jgi:hypothetical protein
MIKTISGKHLVYVVTLYQTNQELDHGEEIRYAVNKELNKRGVVNKVERRELDQVKKVQQEKL